MGIHINKDAWRALGICVQSGAAITGYPAAMIVAVFGSATPAASISTFIVIGAAMGLCLWLFGMAFDGIVMLCKALVLKALEPLRNLRVLRLTRNLL